MTDRIPCINPNCRCTAAQDRFPGSTSIICGKCWRAIPARYRARWKQLKARDRKFTRLRRKTQYADPTRDTQWWSISNRYGSAWRTLINSITHYFTASEQPVGLEDFMKENGLG
ncbi:hypothetical protein [Agrobacterium pusense]|nr:hypothetical protein [Agrobacterium pusense]